MFVDTFKALSDPIRREILQILKNNRMSAGEIAGHFNLTNATISYHLSLLKKAGLIFESKEKNYIFYELNISVLEEIMIWFSELRGEKSEN
ncbi:MAG: autorepressor SdpR family transcription factor [Erysipelotrichaceae bacterium]|nr:autorepressor SdpR family transcription factor [Erysipelotrichaceae bacterium]